MCGILKKKKVKLQENEAYEKHFSYHFWTQNKMLRVDESLT